MIRSNNSKQFNSKDMDGKFSFRINKSFSRNSFKTANNLLSSFKYAANGIAYTFRSQRNFRIQTFVAFFVAIFGIYVKLSLTNLAILTLTIFAVLILELINTSIEAVVDLTVGKSYNSLAQIAKDCSAASVFLAAISSFIIAILLFLPLLSHRLQF